MQRMGCAWKGNVEITSDSKGVFLRIVASIGTDHRDHESIRIQRIDLDELLVELGSIVGVLHLSMANAHRAHRTLAILAVPHRVARLLGDAPAVARLVL